MRETATTAEIEVPEWLIAQTAPPPARPADPTPSPLDPRELQWLRGQSHQVTREMPAPWSAVTACPDCGEYSPCSCR